MKNSKGIIIGIVVLIVAIGGAVALTSSKNDNKDNTKSSSGYNSSSSSNTTSSTKNEDDSSVKNAVATNSVNIKDFAFSPKTITVKAGTTVTWTNQDNTQHQIVADNPSADAPSGPAIGNGQTYSFTFNKPGTYTIHCEIHPYMHGIIVVT